MRLVAARLRRWNFGLSVDIERWSYSESQAMTLLNAAPLTLYPETNRRQTNKQTNGTEGAGRRRWQGKEPQQTSSEQASGRGVREAGTLMINVRDEIYSKVEGKQSLARCVAGLQDGPAIRRRPPIKRVRPS